MKNNIKNFNLHRLLYNKTFVVTLSIISAFVLWLVLMMNQNTARDQVFTDISASISLENTAASEMGLGIVSDISSQKFAVTVNGPSYVVSSLKPDDFTITADVSNINKPGTYNLALYGNRNSNKSGYKFVSITPSSITVTFDYIDSKDFVVTPNLIGVSASEGLIAETPVFANQEQSTVTIKGPRSVLDKISTIKAEAEVNRTLSSTQTFECYLSLYDKNDEIIYRYDSEGTIYDKNDREVVSNNLNISFTSVKITQPISKKRSVNVVPVFSSIPSGMNKDSIEYSVDHTTVTVIGTPDVIDNMTSIQLELIDFSNISLTNNVFEIAPNLPEGVKLLDSIEVFTVRINTVDFVERTFTVTDLRFQNVGSGLNARKNSSIRNVKVCGYKDVVNSLSVKDIYANVDLKGKSAGNYTVDAVICFNKIDGVWAVGEYTSSVTIK